MNSLRLILVLCGIALIAGIYCWEAMKRRRQQRRETILQNEPADNLPELRVLPKVDSNGDITAALADINRVLKRADEGPQSAASIRTGTGVDTKSAEIGTAVPASSTDLFSAVSTPDTVPDRYRRATSDQIVALFVTPSTGNAFGFADILRCAGDLGLRPGFMELHHHYGIGDSPCETPLFSMANMFEPGIFATDDPELAITRGITLFLCLPTPIDAKLTLELMVNTAQRMADILGGEVRGFDHRLLNEEMLSQMRTRIDKASDTSRA